jgi:transaldolase
LKQLGKLGQSIWLDYIRRDLIPGGELRRLIEEDGLRGMTSNPAIFEKAIAGSQDYDEDIQAMALDGKDARAICETLSQRDVQSAADEFRPLYDRTDGTDGDLDATVVAARDMKFMKAAPESGGPHGTNAKRTAIRGLFLHGDRD